MATVCSLLSPLLLLQWKYCGRCQGLKFIHVTGMLFVVSVAITALYLSTNIFEQICIFLPHKNKKPKSQIYTWCFQNWEDF